MKYIELSLYTGYDKYKDRIAKVLKCSDTKTFFVDMEGTNFSEIRSMGIHNEIYAEDCAENFVMGYGAFSK